MPFAHYKGNIISTESKKPQEGKEHNLLHVLQIVDGQKPEIVPIKDYRLDRNYPEGKFSGFCRQIQWSFDGNHGQTIVVLDGFQQSFLGDEKKNASSDGGAPGAVADKKGVKI
jgi:hypothetical protein